MAEPFLGQIQLVGFTFAPHNWALCNGQLLSIEQNTALFALLGTTYGGDGVTTFALPDLRGRAPIHQGQGPSLSNYTIGEAGGSEQVTLNVNQIPSHTHQIAPASSTDQQTTNRPAGAYPTAGGVYASNANGSAMGATTSAASGGGLPHSNVQPYLTMNYVIALAGIFPSQN